jgi:phosphoribosylformimino-5-aminoimidazole carboxamide ribotide isomerase
MRILPVLDLKAGVVVRGVAGRRAEYRPVVSRLTGSAEPLAVARAFREHFQLAELYLADLDAIAGAPPAMDLYAALRADGFRLWVDAGAKEPADAAALAPSVDGIVAGLETVAGPDSLAGICRAFGRERVVFSLDLKEGRPLGDPSAWRSSNPVVIAGEAVEHGVGKVLVLDLARVGMGAGTGSETLAAELLRRHPGIEVWAGGGVRDVGDLKRLRQVGVAAVLVASALHDGKILPKDLASE